MLSKFSWLLNSSFSFSLKDTTKIIKLNIIIRADKKLRFMPKLWSKKEKVKININDLKNTWNLKTAIIEKECVRSLKNDIFDGPKYLAPRSDSISFKLFRCFFTDPE